jgi:hypothetical protein
MKICFARRIKLSMPVILMLFWLSCIRRLSGQMAWKVGMCRHDGVRDYWSRQWSLIDPHVEPLSLATDETGQTVVDVHQVVRDLDGNVIVEQRVQNLYTIEHGLIKCMEIRRIEQSIE